MCGGNDPTHDHALPDLPDDRGGDPFHPPSIPTLVHCIHCNQEYDSYLIEWRTFTEDDGRETGFWCCPRPGCDGKGFGFDIFPVDDDYIDPDGRDMGEWVEDPPPDPDTDIFRPPPDPTPVRCEQCGKEYSSADIIWWVHEDCPPDAFDESCWQCPTPGCWGMGFGDDIRPTDPNYIDPFPDERRVLRPGEKLAPPPIDTNANGDIPF